MVLLHDRLSLELTRRDYAFVFSHNDTLGRLYAAASGLSSGFLIDIVVVLQRLANFLGLILVKKLVPRQLLALLAFLEHELLVDDLHKDLVCAPMVHAIHNALKAKAAWSLAVVEEEKIVHSAH